ncbi:hypothetical protein [Lacunimicrobium album]
MMNPFREAIMADPWETPRSDVPTIHQTVFEQCLQGLEYVRRNKRSTALLIHGAAGSGKTHLFSRLRSRLAPTMPTATDRSEALFVWVRLQTSPRMIWRMVRRTLVNDWFRPLKDARSQFDRILFHRLAQIRVAEGDLEPWYEYMLQEHPDGLRELIDQIASSLALDRNTHVALEHLTFCRHRRDLQAWLCGDSLPEAALARLDLEQADEGDEEREDQARRTVLMLCQLAGSELPIVIGFDQVEALETGSEDRAALFAFGQLVSTLHDSTSNVLIISAVQSAFATRLLDDSRIADRDRMASFGNLSLSPLEQNEAGELIRQRLLASDEPLPPESQTELLWPLSQADLAQLFSSGSVTPRKLLTRCADRFDALLQSTVSDQTIERPPAKTIDDFLEETWEMVVEEKLKTSQPEQTEEILRHSLPMAAQLIEPDLKVAHDDQLPDVSLILEGPSGRTGVSVCTQSNMTSLTARLKRLKSQSGLGRLKRLVVIRDGRVPVSPTAKKAKEYLQDLQKGGASIVHPTPEVLATLDALRALLSDARSGDLAFHGDAVAPKTLEEWFAKQFSNNLKEFVREIIDTGSPAKESSEDSVLIEAINSSLTRQPMMNLADAAGELGVPMEKLVDIARRYPHFFGILGNPESILFRAVQKADHENT